MEVIGTANIKNEYLDHTMKLMDYLYKEWTQNLNYVKEQNTQFLKKYHTHSTKHAYINNWLI